jgi:uncharacterized protein (TIGR03086 family)
LLAAFAAPDSFATVVHHPAGDITGDALLGYALVEWGLHGWDLARALGRPAMIDPGLAQVLYDEMLPVAARLAALGAFAPAVPAPHDASISERLLALLGRRAG